MVVAAWVFVGESVSSSLLFIKEFTVKKNSRELIVRTTYDLLSNIFFGLRYLEMFAAKDIQTRCRNLREMKDVFKELKLLGRKRKSCNAQN